MGKYDSKKKLTFNFLLVMALSLMVALFAMPMAKASAYWFKGEEHFERWVIEDHIKNIWTDKETYMMDKDNKYAITLYYELDGSWPDYEEEARKFAVYYNDEDPEDVSKYHYNEYAVKNQYMLGDGQYFDLYFSHLDEQEPFEFTLAFCEVDSNDPSRLAVVPALSQRVTVKVVPYEAPPTPTPTPEVKHFDITKDVVNFKVTESVINLDSSKKCRIEVTFDLKSLPTSFADTYDKFYHILVREDAENAEDYSLFSSDVIWPSNLQLTGNKFTVEMDVYKDGRFLDSDGIERTEINFLAALAETNLYGNYLKYPTVTEKFKVVNTYTSNWETQKMISDVSLASDTYSLGSEQKIQVDFNNKMLIDYKSSYDKLYFRIVGGDNKVIAETTVRADELKLGANTVIIPCRFSAKGIYNVIICDGYEGQNTQFGPYEIVVQKAKDADGNTIETKDSVSVEKLLYTKPEGSGFKINYSVSDTSSDYHLFVIKGNPDTYYNDKNNALKNTDLMSRLGELPIKLGEATSLTVDTAFNDFGVYTVVLCNITTKQMVAKANFYVVPEDNLIQRDVSKMSDKGIVPFSCSADVFNMDLDKDKKITFNVEFPMNYNKYLKNIKKKYGKTSDGLSSNYFSSKSGSNDGVYRSSIPQRDGTSIKDDNPVTMTVKYCPAGSNKSRVLYKEMLVGIYKTHTIEISAQKLMDAIYATRGSDTAYAGVITVEFSNDPDDITDFYDDYDYNDFEYDDYDPVDEDIIKISEKFSFSVNKAIGIKSATAKAKTVERAYGEGAYFTVVDNLGGTIYADIYKGKKKITTLTAKCDLNNDGTAGGMVIWDLLNKSGKYAAKGSYKAKIYTKSEYTVYEEDGSQSKKSVKSDVKTISFKVKKPSGKLTLEASVSGANGNSVYIENPNVALQYSLGIGSKVSVNVKNSSGTSIYSDTFVAGKGTYSDLLNISGKNIKEGKYKVEVKATTLDGASKSVTASFDVKKMPKPAIESSSVSADSNTGSGSFSFKVTQPATVKVEVKSGSTVKQTVVNQNYSAGTIKSSFSIGGYAAGKYDLVITATNSGGTVTSTKTFEVKKKPVVVKKPTASNISVKFLAGKDGDKIQVNFNYTGKNSKVVIDFMYNDTEEIVYTYEGTTSKDSAMFTYTWDGFKSNGFRAWAGSYTVRVRLVNSAGSTDYLRQNFTIGVG